jgi:cell wall-associated NlpC family hydrolase
MTRSWKLFGGLLAAALAAGCGPGGPGPGWGELRDTLMVSDSAAAFADSMPVVVERPGFAAPDSVPLRDTVILTPTKGVDTKGVSPTDLVAFAKTLIGTPYVYGSTNPKVGFDCSGFITYVFNHFGIAVPRSSIDFTPVGKDVDTAEARPGDLILFTGTNHLERHVGHMGIVVGKEGGTLQFIHSTSGKAMGVTVTPLNEYYQRRFVRVGRVFP